MSSFPKVTIITPSFNQARFLEQAIQSVVEQDYPNLEYIIIDGGSTDGSVELIRKVEHRLAYWVSEPDGGQSAAINKGLRHSTGTIWAWMNADDAYLPGAVRRAVDWLDQHPHINILYGDCLIVNEAGEIGKPGIANEFDFSAMLTGRGWIPTSSTFLKRGVLERLGDIDETFHYVMDLDYWLRAGPVCTFEHVPQAWSLYRVHSHAKTWDPAQSARRAAEFVRMYEQFWRKVEPIQDINHLRSQSLANAYLYAAYLASQSNQRDLCLHYASKSLGMGLSAFRPRLARIAAYLLFGKSVEEFFMKIRPARLQG